MFRQGTRLIRSLPRLRDGPGANRVRVWGIFALEQGAKKEPFMERSLSLLGLVLCVAAWLPLGGCGGGDSDAYTDGGSHGDGDSDGAGAADGDGGPDSGA